MTKRPRDPSHHNPSSKSLQRWANEGGAPKEGRSKLRRDSDQLAKDIGEAKSGVARAKKPSANTRKEN